MEFIMGVEERFGVQLDEEAVNRCATISELAALVTARLNLVWRAFV